jgi:hypothetical protein
LFEARTILKNNGYKILTESSDDAEVYLYLEKSDTKVKVWFEAYGQDASDVRLNLNIDYFKELLTNLGVSTKFFKLLNDLDWDAIKETYEYDGDYAFGEAQSDTWDNGAYGGNNNPDYDWGGEITAQLYNIDEDDVSHFLKNVTSEVLVGLVNGDTDVGSMSEYIEDGEIEKIFTNDDDFKKYIDEFGVTIDDINDFINAMSNENLIQTLTADIKKTPNYSEDLN